jgi:hypothetical protein
MSIRKTFCNWLKENIYIYSILFYSKCILFYVKKTWSKSTHNWERLGVTSISRKVTEPTNRKVLQFI